jgi:hypothetical protein
MRTRVAVLGLVALTLTGCNETGGTTTSSIGTTTTTESATTSTAGSGLDPVDSDWACYYVPEVVAIPIPDAVDRTTFVTDILALLNSSGITAEEIFADNELLLGGGETPADLATISTQIEPVLTLIKISNNDPAEVSVFLNQQDPTIGASPIHAVAPASHWLFKPGTDPVPIDNVELDPVDDADETMPYVGVIDTGFVQETASWAEAPNVRYDEFDIEPDPGLASHGTFITGLIRQISPHNPVSMARVPLRNPDLIATTNESPPSGVALSDELFVFEAVIRMINRHASDGTEVAALNLSLGTYTCDPDGDDLLVVLAEAMEMWEGAFPGSTIFAAGGNEEHIQPFWPGALNDVRAVAAANLNGEQVVWENKDEVVYPGRRWIDDVAPGSNLVSLAGAGNTQFVSWSGSSFATAVASALFARGEDPTADPTGLTWWLDAPVNYDNITGLTYTQSPDPLEPVIHVQSPGSAVTVPTTP